MGDGEECFLNLYFNIKIAKFIYYLVILIYMDLKKLKLIEGMHTIETLAQALNLTKGSAYNLIAKLEKQGYATKTGGGRTKAIYRISPLKDNLKENGMFSILNANSPMKMHPAFKHAVFGSYHLEEAMVDIIALRQQRFVHAALYLFNHVRDWARLYSYARKKRLWTEILSLYMLAKIFLKVRRLPERYKKLFKPYPSKRHIIPGLESHDKTIQDIEQKFNVYLPFNEADFR